MVYFMFICTLPQLKNLKMEHFYKEVKKRKNKKTFDTGNTAGSTVTSKATGKG